MTSQEIARTSRVTLHRCIHATEGHAFYRVHDERTGAVWYPAVLNSFNELRLRFDKEPTKEARRLAVAALTKPRR